MKCRIASAKDRDQLNRISLVSKKYWGYPEAWIQKWGDDLRLSLRDIEELKILVALIEENIIGFCAIQEKVDHYEVLHLWLLPQFIGKGYGRTLLQQALSQFVLTTKPILVTADPNAEEFYRKQGFVKFNKTESYPKGRFLPVMKRESFLKDEC